MWRTQLATKDLIRYTRYLAWFPKWKQPHRAMHAAPCAVMFMGGILRLYVKYKAVVLFLTAHHAMKAYCGSVYIHRRILDFGTRWRWVVSFTPRPLYPQGKSPWYTLDKGWVGPRDSLDAMVTRKIPSPYRDSNPNHPARSLALYRWDIPAPKSMCTWRKHKMISREEIM
jgi:hypothetical protein